MIILFKQFVFGLSLTIAIPSSGIANEGIKIQRSIDRAKTSLESKKENKATVQILKLNLNSYSAENLRDIFDRNNLNYHGIDQINWKTYPYKPNVRFRMAYTDSAFLLHFVVKENAVRGVIGMDNGRVWEDSCVEFFVSPFDDGTYYNFEFNCIGKLLFQGGTKGDRRMANFEDLISIQRWSSLGNQPFGVKNEPTTWELTAIIPFSAFFKHSKRDIKTLKPGKSLTANFYKCGDKHPTPHFVSWSPIDTEKPDFHKPEFFGLLILDE